MPYYDDPKTTLPLLDELESLGMDDEYFRHLHHYEGKKNTIEQHREYCRNHTDFELGGTNEQTARRLAHCLTCLQSGDGWWTAISKTLKKYPKASPDPN